MVVKLLTGIERETRVARSGCCHRCGFQEPGLIAWSAPGREGVHCEECAAHEAPLYPEGATIVFLPEMSVEAFSHYVRVLAWASFAARAALLEGHDFTSGRLPSAFAESTTWDTPVRWRSLAEGANEQTPGSVVAGDMSKVTEASRFMLDRIEYTSRRHRFPSIETARNELGAQRFSQEFRIISPGIALKRIRSWGRAGSTFHLLAGRSAVRKPESRAS